MTDVNGRLRIVRWANGEAIAKLNAFCPACDFEHGFRVDLNDNGKWQRGNNDVWTFNGNWDCPTFVPSMGANMSRVDRFHPCCHSFLENGQWRYLNDCTHALAGTVVDVPRPDPDLSWYRQHGWHLYPHWDGVR